MKIFTQQIYLNYTNYVIPTYTIEIYGTCNVGCQKATWAGCGLHIESALQGVADHDRCAGWRNGKCPEVKSNSNTTTGTTGCGQS